MMPTGQFGVDGRYLDGGRQGGGTSRDSKSGEHARAIFLPLLCKFLVCVRTQDVQWCLFLAPAVLMFGSNSLGN